MDRLPAGIKDLPWPVEDDLQTPETFPATDFGHQPFDEGLIRAIAYAGPPYQGSPTRIFAYYGTPQGEGPFPAMVLIHGGGGTAFVEWVRLWNERGYAALAMDTCGCIPVGGDGLVSRNNFSDSWQRHTWAGPPGWGGFSQADSPPDDHWMRHASGAVVRGHSLLRSFPEIIPDRIGVTGVSWGGVLTCIAAGIDNRFAFAAPVYGCGFIGDCPAWKADFEQMGDQLATRWASLFDPAIFLRHAGMPFLWVNGTNDFAFTLPAWQRSYRTSPGSSTLSLIVRMPHGHGGAGESPAEILAFAEHFLKEPAAPPLPSITSQGRDKDRVWVSWVSEFPIERAELNVTHDSAPWENRLWETVSVTPGIERAETILPHGTLTYFWNIVDVRGLTVSTEHIDAQD